MGKVTNKQKGFHSIATAIESMLPTIFPFIFAPYVYHIIFSIPYSPGSNLGEAEAKVPRCLCGTRYFEKLLEVKVHQNLSLCYLLHNAYF